LKGLKLLNNDEHGMNPKNIKAGLNKNWIMTNLALITKWCGLLHKFSQER